MREGEAPAGRRDGSRYARQVALPGWGEEGQRRVGEATVFIAGAGGLGCAAGAYLAAAGVGRIRICDSGEVEVSNLNRQVLYADGDVGRRKAPAAREALLRVNPGVEVEACCEELTDRTIGRLVEGCAIVLDCLDGFRARYVLNEHAARAGLPFVHAAVRGMSGQVTFIHAPETPCLRCLFPAPPPDDAPGQGRAAGTLPVVGAAAGVVGSLEALEALKHLSGAGETLKGRLLVWDGGAGTFEEIPVRKNPACPVCGGQ